MGWNDGYEAQETACDCLLFFIKALPTAWA